LGEFFAPFFAGLLPDFLLTIWRYECCHCIYFGCPFNRVSAEVRKELEGKERVECEFGEN